MVLRAADRYAYGLWEHCSFCRDCLEEKETYELPPIAAYSQQMAGRFNHGKGGKAELRDTLGRKLACCLSVCPLCVCYLCPGYL